MNKDLDRFYDEAERAIALNPNDTLTVGTLGNHIAYSGRWEQGVALAQKAMALNPTSYPKWFHFAAAKNYYAKGEYEKALVEFRRSHVSGNWLNQLQYAYTYGSLGNEAQAKTAVANLLKLKPGYTIEDAVTFYRAYNFEQSYIDRMVEGLRKAGLPE